MTQVTVRSHHIKISKAIKTYAEEKLAKLNTFFDNIQEIIVELDYSETASDSKRNIASAIVRASGTVIKAKSESADMYAGIDELLEKVSVQLRKYKEKVRNPKRESTSKQVAEALSEDAPKKSAGKKLAAAQKADGGEPIYISKPMDIEDAATILTENGLKFLIFRDMERHAVHVIYPLDSGDLGVIEVD